MSLYILVKNGEDAGIRFKITSGLKIGRKNADYIIKDAAASSLHAQVKESSPGRFILLDCKSKNGIKIKGLREDAISLEAGLVFTVGATDFEVVQDLQEELPPQAPSHNPMPTPPKPPAEGLDIDYSPPAAITPESQQEKIQNSRLVEVEVIQHWNDILENFSQDNLENVKNRPANLLPMNPALRLKFTRGVQTDTEWIIGYGPRVAGSDEYDLTLYDPEAPKNTFELVPTDYGVNFKTKHPETVLYNGRSCDQSLLKEGDEITFGETSIVVELIE